MFQQKPMAAALVLALSAPLAHADKTLSTITVTATRTETAAENVAATVSVLERAEIERRLPGDAADLLRNEADVSLARDLRRFGATRVNIRGIEDNRVTQMVDGVRLPDFYNGGGPTNFTMNAPGGASPDFLKRVEILRGAASSLYGSDAIGGVVGYLTLDPADLLAPEQRTSARYRISRNGDNDALRHSLLGAWRGDSGEALVGYSRATAHAFENMGSNDSHTANRSLPNPQDIRDQGLLMKFAYRPAPGHKLSATLEGRKIDSDVDVLRLAASLPKVSAMSGDDHSRRLRGTVEWQHMPQGAWYERLTARLYHQDSDTKNYNRQKRERTSATCAASGKEGVNNCLIDQGFLFSQIATGASLQFESGLKLGGQDHLLTYGVDTSRVKTEERRDATVRNLTTGTVGKNLAGDIFPLRDFAIGNTDTIAFFAQDEISGLAGGALSLTPSLRYDWRRLSPKVDALAQAVLDSIQRKVARQSDGSLSPKLAAMWTFKPGVSAYGQLARGYRAPNYEEVNGAFRNNSQMYSIVPNPDLKPETSVGLEVGLKLSADKLRGQIALYDNRYRDFITSVQLNCPSDARCVPAPIRMTSMYQNLSRVRIHGAEARAVWDFAPGWKLDGSVAVARGDNRSDDQPLNTVEPQRLSAGLLHDAGAWGAELRLRAAKAVTRTDDSDGAWFRPAGYGVSDLALWWRPMKGAQINLALNNLTDKKYWLWSDIRQSEGRELTGADFYTQPGRKLSASLSYQF
ncbi:TonB-dependent hemoglobin/transferrin/lactoferrin family receptor [Massilia sp. BJB1822]|uniref:TonB-dependent hemoglobin/transferrin/lactoferrin family receptor n=1 Tax=Massilia sp. BJB1822 TaxID=2744470 RepID=UPI001592CA69|nr:TonB-dependent hemoglobin/transferrin/lactoferrin family receptor [Massilia sp. BJB1822]NVD96903.1 TonB-dependent hemoglobin/transferrin/lactoferrin family receptor [Massilia sp. BJB1822]